MVIAHLANRNTVRLKKNKKSSINLEIDYFHHVDSQLKKTTFTCLSQQEY